MRRGLRNRGRRYAALGASQAQRISHDWLAATSNFKSVREIYQGFTGIYGDL